MFLGPPSIGAVIFHLPCPVGPKTVLVEVALLFVFSEGDPSPCGAMGRVPGAQWNGRGGMARQEGLSWR